MDVRKEPKQILPNFVSADINPAEICTSVEIYWKAIEMSFSVEIRLIKTEF